MDEVLGVFRHVPSSKTLDHLGRFLSTWSGTDKRLRAKMNLATVTKNPDGIARLTALSDVIGDARILYRIWGVIPMIQWLISLEKNPPPTRFLLQVERLQAWSMVAYCPMEAIAYLGYHKVLNISAQRQGWLWKHALRLWLLYIVLQFVHIIEDNRILRSRAKALERSRGHPQPRITKDGAEEVAAQSESQQVTRKMWDELQERKDALLTNFWIYFGYFPASVHWATPSGIMSESWVGVFGTIAAVGGAMTAWKASA
ncbi:hypothetical protein MPSI1_000582 [Malassezia psittaci]|uniref:Peroxisomal biogenesis factor 11 n=1 Tax=Malassezia psittaci TaxID=1821823 RepID=A0AAF0F8D3_9BASI|nr:hypothetical protein MPSI1_000582 [Malassezia psittaci]